MDEIKLGDGDERRREKKEMTYRIGLCKLTFAHDNI